MTVPGYQKFMYPFLELLADEKEHTLQEAYQYMANKFNLVQEEIDELLPSGNQSILHNRVGWARTYLGKAELICTIRRGTFVISEEGLKLLRNSSIQEIDNSFLMGYEKFKQFKGGRTSSKTIVVEPSISEITPLEQLEESYHIVKSETTNELIDKVLSSSPAFFERLVVELLVAMGYGGSVQDAGRAIGKSGDEGIDGIIKEDVLGLDMIYVQAKRWSNTVQRPEIQKFSGSLDGQRAKKGVFITTSNFSEGAREFVKIIDKKIILIDGKTLSEYMFIYDIGVAKSATYIVKKVDSDYFENE